MKGVLCCAVMVCLLTLWAAAPARSEEQPQAPAPAAPASAAEPAPAPPPVQEPAQATAQAPAAAPDQAQPGAIEIKEAAVCREIVDRAPVGSAEVFSKDLSRVYCFTRVTGMQGEGAIVHNWYYQGALKAAIKLPVRAANWRTWSYKALSPDQTGEWMVEIMTESGTALESVVFNVQ